MTTMQFTQHLMDAVQNIKAAAQAARDEEARRRSPTGVEPGIVTKLVKRAEQLDLRVQELTKENESLDRARMKFRDQRNAFRDRVEKLERDRGDQMFVDPVQENAKVWDNYVQRWRSDKAAQDKIVWNDSQPAEMLNEQYNGNMIRSLRATNIELSNQNRALHDELRVAQKNLDVQNEKLKERDARVANLDAALEAHRNDRRELLKIQAEKNEEIGRLESKVKAMSDRSQLNEKVYLLNKVVTDRDETIRSLRRAISSWQDVVRQKDQTILGYQTASMRAY